VHTLDEYKTRRLKRHLQDIIRYYDSKLSTMEPCNEVFDLLSKACREAKETLEKLEGKQ
jgi:hypothetical protein